ncbi:MAG: hypothetical protein ACI4NE_09050 [Succinivibrio sp.]
MSVKHKISKLALFLSIYISTAAAQDYNISYGVDAPSAFYKQEGVFNFVFLNAGDSLEVTINGESKSLLTINKSISDYPAVLEYATFPALTYYSELLGNHDKNGNEITAGSIPLYIYATEQGISSLFIATAGKYGNNYLIDAFSGSIYNASDGIINICYNASFPLAVYDYPRAVSPSDTEGHLFQSTLHEFFHSLGVISAYKLTLVSHMEI